MYNKGYNGQRYSGLRQINRENAAQLTPRCVFQTGELVSLRSLAGRLPGHHVLHDSVEYICRRCE